MADPPSRMIDDLYAHAPSPPPSNKELPDYAPIAAADELVVDSQPLADRPFISGASVQYLFTSERLNLNLGPKILPVRVPCYGREATVSGFVEVLDWRNAAKLTVTVSTLMPSGMNSESSLARRPYSSNGGGARNGRIPCCQDPGGLILHTVASTCKPSTHTSTLRLHVQFTLSRSRNGRHATPAIVRRSAGWNCGRNKVCGPR